MTMLQFSRRACEIIGNEDSVCVNCEVWRHPDSDMGSRVSTSFRVWSSHYHESFTADTPEAALSLAQEFMDGKNAAPVDAKREAERIDITNEKGE